MASLTFQLNDHLYHKDPQHTELGQNIIRKSVEMIDNLGFEHFTFKKLAGEINSTEASIYRYFDNKHRLLLYLVNWYWSWIEHLIDLSITNIDGPSERLKSAIRVITGEKKYDPAFAFVDEVALHRIVIAELDKTYLTKWVEQDNKEGLFISLKALCKKLGTLITEMNPDYSHPNSLASTIVLASKQQLFFALHLPSLSNTRKEDNVYEGIQQFIEQLVFATLNEKR